VHTRFHGVFLGLTLATLTVSPRAQAQTYRATSLGANTYGSAINSSGQIVGYTVITGMDQAFLWANGTLTFLDMSGGFAAQAFGINDSGQIVGEIAGLTGSTNIYDAVLWANGTVTNVGSTLSGPSAPSGINASGQVVGTFQVGTNTVCSTDVENAFIWTAGVITNLDPSTSLDSVATAINDAGEAVGNVQSPPGCGAQAAVFAGGTTTILPQLPGGDSSTQTVANAINNAGQIVGYMSTPDLGASNTAVLWYNGSATALSGMGQALGINNTGQIVGRINTNTNGVGPYHAALWTSVGAKPLDLNQLIDPATPLVPGI
jgi:probable HAF family extracellular repeat protein